MKPYNLNKTNNLRNNTNATTTVDGVSENISKALPATLRLRTQILEKIKKTSSTVFTHITNYFIRILRGYNSTSQLESNFKRLEFKHSNIDFLSIRVV